jgi:hypothetical protein
MTFGSAENLAQRLRAIPLERVLPLCGGPARPRRPAQVAHPGGTLSVTGAKFMNWNFGPGWWRGH